MGVAARRAGSSRAAAAKAQQRLTAMRQQGPGQFIEDSSDEDDIVKVRGEGGHRRVGAGPGGGGGGAAERAGAGHRGQRQQQRQRRRWRRHQGWPGLWAEGWGWWFRWGPASQVEQPRCGTLLAGLRGRLHAAAGLQ